MTTLLVISAIIIGISLGVYKNRKLIFADYTEIENEELLDGFGVESLAKEIKEAEKAMSQINELYSKIVENKIKPEDEILFEKKPEDEWPNDITNNVKNLESSYESIKEKWLEPIKKEGVVCFKASDSRLISYEDNKNIHVKNAVPAMQDLAVYVMGSLIKNNYIGSINRNQFVHHKAKSRLMTGYGSELLSQTSSYKKKPELI